MAIPFDLVNARLAAELEIQDIRMLHSTPLPTAERLNLNDRLAALQLHLEEINLLLDGTYWEPPRRAHASERGNGQNPEISLTAPVGQLPADDRDDANGNQVVAEGNARVNAGDGIPVNADETQVNAEDGAQADEAQVNTDDTQINGAEEARVGATNEILVGATRAEADTTGEAVPRGEAVPTGEAVPIVEAQIDTANENDVTDETVPDPTDRSQVHRSGETHGDADGTLLDTAHGAGQDHEEIELETSESEIECHICYGDNRAEDTVTIGHCQHKWCRTCIRDAFENAIANEVNWPPKCCQLEITPANANKLMTADLRGRYTTKSIEWSTANRTYCYEKTCSTFVQPQNSSNVQTSRRGTCQSCSRVTCTACKQQYHEEEPCPENSENDNLLRDMAARNMWRTCYSCRKLVSITTGCCHIT
jgi:hypothetical protein